MSKRLNAMAVLALTASTGLLAAQETVGKEAGAPPAVDVSFAGGQLVAQPRVGGASTSVYVSCADGTYSHSKFEGVGAALVDLVRTDGAPIRDGRCKYEVLIYPPVDQEAIRVAAESGDDATLERLSRLAAERTVRTIGRFMIEGGVAAPGWSK